MKLTTEMKKYIRNAVKDKAEIVANEIRKEIDGYTDKYRNAIGDVVDEADKIAEEANRKIVAFAKSRGLTILDDYNIINRATVPSYFFAESWSVSRVSHNDANYCVEMHKRNPKLLKLEEKLMKIYNSIDTECGRLFFNIEVGGDRGKIEDMIANIKF